MRTAAVSKARSVFRLFGGLLVAAACLSGGFWSSSLHAQPQLPGAIDARAMDTHIDDAIRAWDLAGLSIAVVKDDSVVYLRGFGVREAGKPERVDEDTLFAIGSNTKLFTAVLAGTLVDDGRIGWDDKVIRHLPGFVLHDPYVTREITLRDLLAHRSGLEDNGALWYGSGQGRAEILRLARYLGPQASFRETFEYHNIMYLAAGEAIAAAAGRSWDDLVQERIYAPLGMGTSNTSIGELRGQRNVAVPHMQVEGRLVPIRYRNLDNIAPAGAINSSAREMAQWLRMLLADGVYEGKRLIAATTLREILTPQSIERVPPDTLFPSIRAHFYGLGAMLHEYRGEKVVWHTGSIDGMRALVGMLPERRLGVVVLTNAESSRELRTALMYRVFDIDLGAPESDWSQAFLARAKEDEVRAAARQRETEVDRVAGTSPTLPLDRYAGTYRHQMLGGVTVALENDRLVLRREGDFTGPLEHWHHDTFFVNARDPAVGRWFVTFALDRAAQVVTLEEGGRGTFQRLPEP